MLDSSIKTIAIIGPGLLGGSIGLGLRKRGYNGTLVGMARKQATLNTALSRKCIDAAVNTIELACTKADLVILCTPVNTIRNQLVELASVVRERTIITDVGSTKQSIVADAHRLLKHHGNFVGSHPMAGSELTGPESADADLYEGKPVVITPTNKTDAAALRIVEGLWTTLGMRVLRMDAAEHDRAVAMVSHLPHVLSVLLMQSAAAPGNAAMDMASTGLCDMTRLAGGDVPMWADILTDNRAAIVEAMNTWHAKFDALRDAITKNDRKQIEKILTEARDLRVNWLQNRFIANGGE